MLGKLGILLINLALSNLNIINFNKIMPHGNDEPLAPPKSLTS